MSDNYLPKALDLLWKDAQRNVQAGNFDEKLLDFKLIFTLEEMAKSPADKEAEKQPINQHVNIIEDPTTARCEEKLHPEKPSDSNDNGIFRDASGEIHGRAHWELPTPEAIDPSDSKATGTTRLIDLEKEWQEKPNRHLIIFTEAPDIYPSKGCP